MSTSNGSGEPRLARAKNGHIDPANHPADASPLPLSGGGGRVSPEDEASTRGRETANKSYWQYFGKVSRKTGLTKRRQNLFYGRK